MIANCAGSALIALRAFRVGPPTRRKVTGHRALIGKDVVQGRAIGHRAVEAMDAARAGHDRLRRLQGRVGPGAQQADVVVRFHKKTHHDGWCNYGNESAGEEEPRARLTL
jgi:hypothetical protein